MADHRRKTPDRTGLQSVGLDFTDFESGGDLEVASTFGGGLFVVPGEQASATAGPDGRVLIGQFTSAAQMSWTLNIQYRTPDGSSPDVRGVSITFPDQVPGCVDPMACNTDAYAVVDDGSCAYPDGYPNHTLDCEGQCVSDVDGDGVCDPMKSQAAPTRTPATTTRWPRTMTVPARLRLRYTVPPNTTALGPACPMWTEMEFAMAWKSEAAPALWRATTTPRRPTTMAAVRM